MEEDKYQWLTLKKNIGGRIHVKLVDGF